MLAALLIFAFSALLPAASAAEARTRLVVLTDFYKDPDDKQSMIRLLTYANEFEMEGLIATSLAFGDGSVRPELLRELIREYGSILPNLRRHERPGYSYPSAQAASSLVRILRA